MSGFLTTLPLILIMLLGGILKKRGFYSETDVKLLTKTLFWIIMPALLYRSTFVSGKEVLVQPALLKGSSIAYIVTIVFVWCLGRLIFYRANTRRLATSVMGAIRGNNVYLGIPLVYLAMGNIGVENASIYMAVTTIGYQLCSIGGGDLVLSEKLNIKNFVHILKRLSKNPQIIACFAGVFTALLGVNNMPIFLDETLKLLGSAASALALLMIGASIDLGSVNKTIKMFYDTAWDIFVRLVAHPFLMYVCLLYFGVPKILMQVTVLISAMPTAVNVYVFAKEMGMDGEYGAELVIATTLCSALTVPIWIRVLGIV